MMLAFLLFAGLNFAFAQTKTISGTVTSADDGSGLPGVTVLVKGTQNGTITDINGKYSLEVKNSATTLVFSFVGMKTQEVDIAGKTTINVTLSSVAKGLNEVVVLGYTTKGKNEITGSSVQVKGADIDNVPVVTVDQALQGKVPGLSISTSSGTPGSVQDIRIRGVGSITAGNDPLIVIDGVPVINSNFSGSSARSSLSALAALNSDDIASITVLKDASATSAYGARGSNGVIVITTKKGRKNTKTSYNFTSSIGYQNNAVTGEVPLTGEQKKTLFLEGVYNSYGAAYGFSKDGAYDFVVANGLDGGDLQNWNGKDGNWGNLVANKNAPIRSFNLSATGGDKLSSFYVSLGYDKTEATVIGSDFRRVSATLNYDRKLSKTLEFSTNNVVSNTFQNSFLEQSAYFANPFLTKYFMSPWEQPYNDDGTLNTHLNTSVFNTLYLAKNNISTNDLTRAISNSYVTWNILENLKFKTLISLDYSIANYKSYENRHHGDAADVNGSSEASTGRNLNIVAQNSLDYTLRVHDHTFAFKALMEYQKNKYNYIYAYGENIPTDGLTNVANTSANKDASSSFTDWSNISYLGMLNYNYLGKYIADFTFRREGSSRFAPGKRYGNFWAVGAAWNINREAFLSDVDFINQLKLRASYGLSGNSAIDINSYQALLAYDGDYADQGAIYPSQFGNNNLTWEKNKNLDIGLDFTIWKNRVSGSFAYYHKNTFDLLQNVPLSMTTGHSSQTQNVGAVLNKGIEAMLSVDIIQSKKILWTITANYATVNNEVTKLAKDANGEDINIETGTRKVEVGHPIYAWNMRKYAGVDPDNGKPQWYLDGKSGDLTYNYYDAAKAYQGGSAMPTYTGGLATSFNYSGFFINASLYFSGGNKVYQDWSFYTNHSGVYANWYFNGVSELMNRWQKPGDVTDVPRELYSGTADNSSRTSTRFLYDGDYIRLKDLTVGYNFSKKVIHRFFQNATLYVKATNFFTRVKDKRLKYDPEVRADGFTRLTTPPVKSIVVGLNLKF